MDVMILYILLICPHLLRVLGYETLKNDKVTKADYLKCNLLITIYL